MLIIAKIFATVLGLLVISRSFIDFKRKKESFTMTVFWILIWAGILALAYYPNLVDELIKQTGGQRTGIGTVFGMAIAFVLFINYRIYVKANRVEKAVIALAKEIMLININNAKK